MEEQKKNKRASYEDLNNYCMQLAEQNQQLKQREEALIKEINRLSVVTAFKRLDYLFEVLQYKDFFSEQFVSESAEEIESALAVPAQEEKTENTEEKKEEEKEA